MKEVVNDINDLKKKVFYDLLSLAGRVFIIIKHSEEVVIGKRGFLDDEKKNGLILVFNRKMKFIWDGGLLEAKLVFGATPHKCIIPVDSIVAVYSPDLNVQFVAPHKVKKGKEIHSEEKKDESIKKGNKVVKVDFGRKRQKG